MPYVFYVSITQCLASFHLAYLRSSSEHPGTTDLVEAHKYLNTALADFRTQVTVVTKANWIACISFAMDVLVVNIDTARRAPITDFQAAVVEPIKSTRITLTMRKTIRQHLFDDADAIRDLRKQQELRRAQLEVAVKERRMCLETFAHLEHLLRKLERHIGRKVATLHTKSEDYIAFIRDYSSVDPPSEEGVDTRLLAALSLRAWAQQTGGYPGQWGDFTSWAWCLSAEFISFLAAKDEAAVVIVIYWFVIINRISWRWFLDGWAQRAVIASLRHIGPGWDDVLAWPKSQLGLDTVATSWRNSPESYTSTT